MAFWRRGRPLHERLAEQGGLTPMAEPPHDTMPHWGEAGIHGIARPRRWDAVASAEAPELTGDEVHFVAIPDGSLIVDEDVPDDALSPLADAIEATLAPPYRAEAVRRGEQVWAVAARRIEVIELEEDVAGDALDLAVQNGERTLLVDGARSFGSISALERLASERFEDYVAHAERLDGPLWELVVRAL